MTETVVLAFSGGLDTSWCIPHLQATRGCAVLAVTVDTGGLDARAAAELAARAAALGAREHVLVDGKPEYFASVLRFLVAGNVRRGGTYPLSVGAERSIQAKAVARLARQRGASAVAHGSTAAGNDQVRFEVALRAFDPGLEILAPVRDTGVARAAQVELLERLGLPVPPHGAAYSVNRGLWGTTIGGQETKRSDLPLPEEAWVATRGAFAMPLPPARHRLAFERGIPSALDGQPLDPVALIERVEGIAAPFGIGRGMHLGETVLGIKGRVAFEAPAAETILVAHRELEKLVLTGRQLKAKELAAALYGDLVHEGQHADPAARDLEALLASSQERVTGEVQLLFRPGLLQVEGVASPFSLLAASRAAYGETAAEWSAADARGFARLVALPAELHARAGSAGGER